MNISTRTRSFNPDSKPKLNPETVFNFTVSLCLSPAASVCSACPRSEAMLSLVVSWFLPAQRTPVTPQLSVKLNLMDNQGQTHKQLPSGTRSRFRSRHKIKTRQELEPDVHPKPVSLFVSPGSSLSLCCSLEFSRPITRFTFLMVCLSFTGKN